MKHQAFYTSKMFFAQKIIAMHDAGNTAISNDDLLKAASDATDEAIAWKATAYTDRYLSSENYASEARADRCHCLDVLSVKIKMVLKDQAFYVSTHRDDMQRFTSIRRLNDLFVFALLECGFVGEKNSDLCGSYAHMTHASGAKLDIHWDYAQRSGPGILPTTGYIAVLTVDDQRVDATLDNLSPFKATT